MNGLLLAVLITIALASARVACGGAQPSIRVSAREWALVVPAGILGALVVMAAIAGIAAAGGS